MGDIRVVQQVRSGNATEYYGVAGQAVSIAASDKLIMSFDAEIYTEEIIVVNSGSLTWSMNIVYPQTGITNFVYSSTGNYSLNGGNAGAGTKPTVKTWFRLPANSSIELTFSSVTTSGKVELFVLGR